MDLRQPLRIFTFRGRTVIQGCAAALTEAEFLSCARSWVYHLDDRGVMYVAYSGASAFVELRKRRWKTRPDVLLFRYRNADATRTSFIAVRDRFASDGVQYQIALTRKTRRPRALEVRLDPYDPHMPRVALNLAVRALGDAPTDPPSYDVWCAGKVRDDTTEAPMPLEYPLKVRRQDKAYDLGFRIGATVRRVISGGRGRR